MKIILTENEKQNLEKQHRSERDKHISDRMKAILLSSEGWAQVDIAQALRIGADTVHDYLNQYLESKKLNPESGGSLSKLSDENTEELIKHLEEVTYVKAIDICAYVMEKYGVEYTVSGMTKWLHEHKFSFKHPKGTPAKANPVAQAQFELEYKALIKNKAPEDPCIFIDGVHPTMATKITYGWIRKGKDKPIATTASRTRVNIIGGINLETMKVKAIAYETLNGDAMVVYFRELKAEYPDAKNIHVILDQGRYNTCQKVKEAAIEMGIVLHYLPTYSPNLNPIERLWKVMNEYVRNNRFFKYAEEFRRSIDEFFQNTWPHIASSMRSRINDHFQKLEPTFSS